MRTVLQLPARPYAAGRTMAPYYRVRPQIAKHPFLEATRQAPGWRIPGIFAAQFDLQRQLPIPARQKAELSLTLVRKH